jgi:hypothetical protein
MQSGASLPQQGTQQDKPAPNVERSPQNPLRGDQEQLERMCGLTKEEGQRIVGEIIQPFRTQWATDRIMKMPNWLKSTEYDKGKQILGWDPVSRTYFDAVAWYRQNNQESDYSYLEKYVNNITQTCRRNFSSAVARAVPPVVIRPENAENLADMTTAKAAQEAISIIEEANAVKGLLGLESQYLYLYGVYFKWTRFVIDGTWVGYKDEPIYGDVEAKLSDDGFHCTSCGQDSSESQVAQSGAMQCPHCGAPLGPQDFHQGESSTVIGQTGTKKKPNGLPKWSIYSPLQVDTDPTKEYLADVPLLALEWEVDASDIRATFPDMAAEITEGVESATNDNASYERLVRTMVYSSSFSVTADIFAARGTYSLIWVQPNSYYRISNDDAFLQKLQSLFPYGLKLSMWGPLVLNVEPAVLIKEWSCCKLHRGYGLYPPSVADNVVPFNERFNAINNILDDYMERCSTGITLVDPRRIDIREMSGKPLTGGVLNPTPSVGEGIQQPLGNAIYHFEFEMDPGLMNYLDRLWNYCQIISGIPPQVSGTGTTPGVETGKGQKQMLDQAMGPLGDIYDAIKDEHAAAGQNAIECLQVNMAYTGSIWQVIEENGSEFRNNYVHLDEMQGRVRVKANTDEGLPMTPEQKRQWCETIMEMAEKQNPAAIAWLDETANQQLLNDYWGLPGSVAPGAAQRSKTLQDIRRLLQTPPTPKIGPNGMQMTDPDDGTPMFSPSIAPNKWVEDYDILLPTIDQFCAENCDVKQQNPLGWANVIAFKRLAIDYQASVESYKEKLKGEIGRAGAPPPPQPNPTVQQMEAAALQDAMGALGNLSRQSAMPPLGPSASIAGQVSAGRELVDKVAKFLTPQ